MNNKPDTLEEYKPPAPVWKRYRLTFEDTEGWCFEETISSITGYRMKEDGDKGTMFMSFDDPKDIEILDEPASGEPVETEGGGP